MPIWHADRNRISTQFEIWYDGEVEDPSAYSDESKFSHVAQDTPPPRPPFGNRAATGGSWGRYRLSRALDTRTDTYYYFRMATKKPKKKNPAAVALSKLAAVARRKKISPERRSELASHAVRARWAKVKQAEADLKGGRPVK